MNKKIGIGNTIALMILAATIAFVITAASFFSFTNARLKAFSYKESFFSRLFELDDIVRNNYVGEINNDNLIDSILTGYVNGINDRYSSYLNKDYYNEFTQDIEGKSEGIGIQVSFDSIQGALDIVRVEKNSPAEKAGIKKGDKIVKIEGKNVSELTLNQAMVKLKGKVNTEAKFTVLRDKQTLDFAVKREVYETISVEYTVINGDVGLIRIHSFNKNTPKEFDNAMAAIKKDSKSVIFDVRNNLGGELNSITTILDKILPEGPIIRIVDKENNEEKVTSDKNEITMPMAVLINNDTYSAAELFASALSDYKKAKLIGTKTYGKGTMQRVFNLVGDTAVNLSTRYFLPPFSKSFNGVGISPDIEIKMSEQLSDNISNLTLAEDVQLQAALTELKK